MSAAARGDLLLLLHAHLPYVRHPENSYHLEENWLYEAITATYLPLVQELQKFGTTSSGPKLTLSLSPTLCSMLRDKLLTDRYRSYLDRLLRLGEEELTRAKADPAQSELVRFTCRGLPSCGRCGVRSTVTWSRRLVSFKIAAQSN